MAVDADANSNLNEVLGVEVQLTLGALREEIAQAELKVDNPIPLGMSKKDYTDWKFNSAIVEEDDYDMLVMGRSPGQGCYCFVNDLLRAQIMQCAQNYKYVVVDNEAGLEHISRGTLPKMDTLLLVSDCSRRGVQAAGRIAALMKELDMKPEKTGVIINRAPDGVLDEGTWDEIEKQGLSLLGVIPQDETVYRYDCDGRPLVELPGDSPVKKALYEILEGMGW